MELSSYLRQIIRYPSTCGSNDSETTVAWAIGVLLTIILICFTLPRAVARNYSKPWQQNDRQIILRVGTPIIWCDSTHYLAVGFAFSSIVLFMAAGKNGLGKHLCDIGFTDRLVAFIQRVLAASQARTDAELMAYLNAHSTALDSDLTKSLQIFLTDFSHLLILLFSCDACYVFAVSFQKVSNDFSLLSMFGFNDSFLQKIIRWHLALTAVNFLLTLGMGFFGTWPPQASWEIATDRSWALPSAFIYRFTAASDLLLDCSVIWIPFWKLVKLQLPGTKKAVLIGLFSSQGLAIAFGLVRIFFLGGLFGEDLSYKAATPLILTMVQLTVYVVSFSVPILRQLAQSLKASPQTTSSSPGNVNTNLQNRGGDVRGSHLHLSEWSRWSSEPAIDLDFIDEAAVVPIRSATEISISINGPPTVEENLV